MIIANEVSEYTGFKVFFRYNAEILNNYIAYFMLKKSIKWIVLGAILLFLFWLGYWWWFMPSSSMTYKPVPTLVKTSQVAKRTIPLTASAIGMVASSATVILVAQTEGLIQAIHFKPGQFVQKGQVLLNIDDHLQKAQLAQKQAELAEAKSVLQRNIALAQQDPDAVTQATLEQLRSLVLSAEAQVTYQKQQLANTIIRAPFSGTISAFLPSLSNTVIAGEPSFFYTQLTEGAYVTVGTALATLVNPQIAYVEYALPEAQAALAKLGQSVIVSGFDAQDNSKSYRGQVIYIAPSVTYQKHTVMLRATIAVSADKALLPGTFLYVTQVLLPDRKVIAIPGLAVSADMTGYGVDLIKRNQVVWQPITLGERKGDWVEVTKGLQVGDSIIVAGQEKVHPGSLVKVVSAS